MPVSEPEGFVAYLCSTWGDLCESMCFVPGQVRAEKIKLSTRLWSRLTPAGCGWALALFLVSSAIWYTRDKWQDSEKLKMEGFDVTDTSPQEEEKGGSCCVPPEL